MQICHNHYYCLCGVQSGTQECHYCRKKESFYRRHYICLDCHIGWKSKHEIKLKRAVDGSQLLEVYDNMIYEGTRCKCGKNAIEVGRDFRVPKILDQKSWNQLKNKYKEFSDDMDFSFYMRENYTHKCNLRSINSV